MTGLERGRGYAEFALIMTHLPDHARAVLSRERVVHSQEKGMQKLLLGIAFVSAVTLAAGTAGAQGRGGGAHPTWQGSNPPGFGVQVNRPGWNGGTQPPGWSHAQSAPGWKGGGVPPGLAKQSGRH